MNQWLSLGLAIILGACAVASPAKKSKPMKTPMFKSPEITQDFIDKIGLESLPPSDSEKGVAASWNEIPQVLDSFTKEMRMFNSEPIVLVPGLVSKEWIWSLDEDFLALSISVSGDGSQLARDQLVNYATNNMMSTIPFEPGPKGLGEVAIRTSAESPEIIVWVYENVCVQLKNSGSSISLTPIAHTVQDFIESHYAEDLPQYVPSVIVTVKPKKIPIGKQFEVELKINGPKDAEYVGPTLVETHPRILSIINMSDESFTLIGEAVGTTTFGIHIADRSSLLSPANQVGIEIFKPE